ncbi:hypothetical protein BaRGS_00011005 [Batillaria attramentaria]|uniref:Uncharacterized protein n=1 Tax=Batillaria attramentaria TaxID=370345 RepID=A0ABD0LET9_9CAEN
MKGARHFFCRKLSPRYSVCFCVIFPTYSPTGGVKFHDASIASRSSSSVAKYCITQLLISCQVLHHAAPHQLPSIASRSSSSVAKYCITQLLISCQVLHHAAPHQLPSIASRSSSSVAKYCITQLLISCQVLHHAAPHQLPSIASRSSSSVAKYCITQLLTSCQAARIILECSTNSALQADLVLQWRMLKYEAVPGLAI